MKRFVIKNYEKENYFAVIDHTNGVVVVFENKNFNGSKKITVLNNIKSGDFMKQAKQMREVEKWIFQNHKEKF